MKMKKIENLNKFFKKLEKIKKLKNLNEFEWILKKIKKIKKSKIKKKWKFEKKINFFYDLVIYQIIEVLKSHLN